MNCTINTIGDNLIVKFCNHLSGCLRKGFVPSSRNHCFVNFSPISRTRSGVSNFTLLLTGNSRRESTRKFMVARHFVMDGEAERTRLEAKLGDRPQLPAVNEYSSQTEKNPDELIVASFYKFSELRNYAEMRQPIRELCEKNLISGGIILAEEGINGSICGKRRAIELFFSKIREDERLSTITYRESPAGAEEEAIHGQTEISPLSPGPDAPFRWDHVRVKLKQEIVSMGVPGVDPSKEVGKYVGPEEWNELLKDPETVVIDVRNTYEIRIGKFKGAVDPRTESFRQFPKWVDENLEPLESSEEAQNQDLPSNSQLENSEDNLASGEKQKTKKVAMYCTGGIRCEKATSFMLKQGFDEVYHLEGGILRYLDEVPPEQSLWEGECFVFDKRVSVGHGLNPGNFHLCYACKQPVSEADKESQLWEEGVSCPYCYHSRTEEEKARARARQAQFEMWGIVGGPDKGRKPKNKEKARSPRHSNQKS